MRNGFLIVLAALAFLWISTSSLAAVTVDSSSSAVSATKTSKSVGWSHNIGSGANRLLVVGVSVYNKGTNSVTSVTFGGSSMSRLGTRSINSGGYNYLTEMWYLLSPPSGTTLISLNTVNPASIVAGAVSFSGVDQSSPLGTFASATGSSKTPSVTAMTVAGDLVLDTLTARADSKINSVGAGQTIQWNPKPAGGKTFGKGAGSTKSGAAGVTTMSWSGTRSGIWCIGAVPVHAALNSPVLSKSFGAGSILLNGTTTMTLTFTNPNSTFISGLALNDNYPANLVNAAAAPSSNTCGGTVTISSGGSSLSLADGIIPASGSCSLTVPVTSSFAGTYVNTTGAIYSANALPGLPATSGTLTVMAPPSASKNFSPDTILPGGGSSMTITLSNPNQSSAITGVSFTDPYPGSVKNTAASPSGNTCGGVVTMSNGGSSLALSGGTIPAAGSCSVTVPVTSMTAGVYTNSTGSVGSANAGTGAAGSAALTVVTYPTCTKSFSPKSVLPGAASAITVTLLNSNPTPITGVSFTDSYPSADLQNTAATPSSNTCGGVVSMTNGGSSFALSGGTIPSLGSCNIVVPVSSSVAGSYLNTTGLISTDNAGTIPAAADTLTVMGPPVAIKSFVPSTAPVSSPAYLNVMLTNPNPLAITGASFTDSYPSATIKNSSGSPHLNTCGGTVTMSSGGNSFALAGGTIPALGSCTVEVTVTPTASGTYTNSTGTVSTANAGIGTASSATLIAMSPPAATKVFSPSTILPGASTNLTITLSNPNATPITGAAFSDSYPVNMVNTSGTPVSNTCGGLVAMSNGGGSLALTGGVIPSSGSCSLVVPVTSIEPGGNVNSTGPINTANAGSGAAALGTLTVTSPPVITKTFAPAVILPNGATAITFDLVNSNSFSITGVGFTDLYPSANMKNTAGTPTSNTCGGTVSMTNGGSSFSLSGGVIPAAGVCVIVVPVTATVKGIYENSTGPIISTNAGTGDPDTDILTVLTSGGALKEFSPATIQTNTASLLAITLQNPNSTDIRNVAFTDIYPAGLVNTSSASPITTCGGTVTAVNGGTSLSLSGGTIPASDSCTVMVYVTSSSAGSYLNSTGTVTTNSGNIPAATATLTVKTPPQIVLTQSEDILTGKPGDQITYAVHYKNIGSMEALNLVISGSVPPNTAFVPGSLRSGNASSTYATATPLTDAIDGDSGYVSGTSVIFIVNSVSGNDGIANSGTDEGRVYFKVVIQ